MKNLILNGQNYEPTIENGNITLVGLTDDIILIDALDEFEADAKEASTYQEKDHDGENWHSIDCIDKDVYNDYVRENLPAFCLGWLAKGKPVNYETKNLN